MSSELVLNVIFRWAHIFAAIAAVGGLFFMRFVLWPAASEALSDEQHQALRARIVARWRLVVMICITLLLVSGFYNFFTQSLDKGRGNSAYHPLFGVKFLAALGVFFIASVLTGRSSLAERFRADGKRWMTLNLAIAVVVILTSGILKNLPIAH